MSYAKVTTWPPRVADVATPTADRNGDGDMERSSMQFVLNKVMQTAIPVIVVSAGPSRRDQSKYR